MYITIIAAFLICTGTSLIFFSSLLSSFILIFASLVGIIGVIYSNKKQSKLNGELKELREENRVLREKYEAIEDEKRQVEERSREQNQEQSDSSSAIEALSRQCHCVSTGGEIGRRLTSIVKEKTEDATLDLTNRVYRILELSEELNATIQKVIGGLSADEEGLKNDVQLIEEEQEKITVLIEEFTGIRDGYSKEMKTIESYMKSVEEFTVSIDDIADRTNILAINASIEAARAGELGKGFAVIGNEIQELSKTTMSIAEQITSTIAEASKAISSSISLYEERIGSAVKSLKKSGDMHSILIEKLAPQIDSLSAVVSSSSNLSSEIHENVDGMAKELQYQDRIQQIITHLIQFLDEMGQEARKTASIYYKVSKNEQESIKETMVERAARYFTTDEEHDEFGYERPQDNNSEGTSSQSEDFEGDVVLF